MDVGSTEEDGSDQGNLQRCVAVPSPVKMVRCTSSRLPSSTWLMPPALALAVLREYLHIMFVVRLSGACDGAL